MAEPLADDVLTLWDNLPASARGGSITFIVTYLFTFGLALLAGRAGLVLDGVVLIGLLVWPLIVIAWLLVIWMAFAVISTARALIGGDKKERSLKKTIIFIPAVIGTAFTVVDVFVKDIFSQEE